MTRVIKRIKNTLIYWLVLYLILFVRVASRATAFLFFRNLAIFAYHVIRSERRKVERHLSLAFGEVLSQGEVRALARQVFIDLGRNGVDALRIPLLRPDRLHQLVRVEGKEHLDRAFARGKGVICVTGHIGSWELLAATVAMMGYPLYVIGKPIYDPRLDRIVVRNREIAGSHNLARGTSIREILRTLRYNCGLGILIDQDTDVEGVFVNFFGKPAYTPVGPVVLALKTGASIVPMAIHLTEELRHRVLIREPMKLSQTGNRKKDLVVNTQKLSDFLEEMIRLYPSQWVWMHERWKTRPEKHD